MTGSKHTAIVLVLYDTNNKKVYYEVLAGCRTNLNICFSDYTAMVKFSMSLLPGFQCLQYNTINKANFNFILLSGTGITNL